MTINETQIALITSLFANLAALISVIITVFQKKAEEIRLYNRKIIEGDVKELGIILHNILAPCYVIVSRIECKQNYSKWKRDANVAKEELKEIRLKVRYSLWGIDEYINDLAKLPDWLLVIATKDTRVARTFLKYADNLRIALDNSIRYTYSSGNGLRIIDILRVKFWSKKYKDTFINFRKQRYPNSNEIFERVSILRKYPDFFSKLEINKNHIQKGINICKRSDEIQLKKKAIIQELEILDYELHKVENEKKIWLYNTDQKMIHSEEIRNLRNPSVSRWKLFRELFFFFIISIKSGNFFRSFLNLSDLVKKND